MLVAATGGSRGGRVLKKAGLALLAILVLVFLASFALRRFLALVGRTREAVSMIDITGRRVAMWKPTGPVPPGGYPVILFSHGFTGCGTQSVFVTDGLAQAGYFVLAPDHHDAACGPNHEGRLFEKFSTMKSEPPFHKPDAWSEATYRDRGADLEAVLDAVLKQKSFQGIPIDSSRIGLVGHSLGGYTVLALAGAWPSWKDHRVKAVLALSPYCAPFNTKGDLAHLNIPVMYQGGTLDLGITPLVRRPGGAYDLTSPPKYFIELSGAGHFAWTNLNKSHRALIKEYAVTFFDRYLKGATNPDPLAHLIKAPWSATINDLRYAAR
jgi:predicted dienelactone hydrolase